MIDKSTDIACISTMCIAVQFFDNDIGKITSQFWDLLPVYNLENPDEVHAGAYIYMTVLITILITIN